MIRVELSSEQVCVEPGGTAQLTVKVTNRQEIDDLVFIDVEGIDSEWYALPMPSVAVAAGAEADMQVLFRLPRTSECQAGSLAFVVRAKGMEAGATGAHTAALVITPFSSLQLELSPKRATSTAFRPRRTFHLSVSNLGNHPETLDLSGTDPGDGCAYEFERDRVTVKPGGSETVDLVVEPRSRPLVGSSNLFGFTVTTRSSSDAYVSANASGQLERRPFLSTLALTILLLACVVGAGAWWVRPRPVSIRSFQADTDTVMAGTPVTLTWDVQNLGDGSHILPDTLPIKGESGNIQVKPLKTTEFVLVARNGNSEKRMSVVVNVTPPPKAPKPKISSFTASSRRIHTGESAMLSWEVDGAAMMVLNPIGALNPGLDRSRQVTPDQTTTYVLSAQGMAGEVVTKSVTITVVPPNVSIAEIKGFRATPASIHSGEVANLTWSVEGAATVEIDNGVGTGLNAKGRFDVMPTQTTVYTLRAGDARGNVVTAQATVTVTAAEAPSAGVTPP